jgi:hypothetical protein
MEIALTLGVALVAPVVMMVVQRHHQEHPNEMEKAFGWFGLAVLYVALVPVVAILLPPADVIGWVLFSLLVLSLLGGARGFVKEGLQAMEPVRNPAPNGSGSPGSQSSG